MALSQLERTFLRTIDSLTTVMEIRDLYTAGHQNRTADIARRIATEVGLETKIIDGVRLGATLHDIGKIGIPIDILNKPASLTSQEFELVKTHTLKGYDVLKHIDFPWPIADIVHQHHERIDGSGYPLGLTERDILVEAQIVGLADTVESITSFRPYRSALGIDIATQTIKEGAAKSFNADLVAACCKLIERGEIITP